MSQEASFTFTTPLNVNIVNIKGIEHTFVEGDISTNDIDFVDDIMSKKCQDSIQKQVLERNMKLDIEHEAFKGKTTEEKEINKTKIPAGKLLDAVVKALGKGRFGTRVKAEINRHRKDYENIKGYLVDKYLDAFSVAFLATEIKYIDKDGKSIRVIDDCILLNVALTGNPCNTKAQIIEVTNKSMDALEDYKKRKEKDPSVEDQLIVKSNDQKQNPLNYVWDKIYSGELLTKAEQNLVKAAMAVANNKGIQESLAKELFDKIISGVKLSYKDYYIFRELIEVDYQTNQSTSMAQDVPYKSQSNGVKSGDNIQLNKPKNSKMTDKKEDPVDPIDQAATDVANGNPGDGAASADAGTGDGDAEEPGKVEGKAIDAITANMKAMAEKYDSVKKENEDMRVDMKAMAENIGKIVEALKNPIHKSSGVHIDDAARNADPNTNKSVDPLSLF